MRISRVICLLAIAAALVPFAAAADEVRHGTIPASLWARWAPRTEDCGVDKSTIVLSGKRYVGEELDCAVLWVVQTVGAAGMMYSARLNCTDGNGQKTFSDRLLVPKAADQILIGTRFDSLKPYQRCPAASDSTDKK